MNRIGKALIASLTLAVLGLVLSDPHALADTLIRGSQIKTGTVTSTQLSSTGVTAASYGSGTSIPSFTVDAAGRITAASATSISASLLPASVTKGNVIVANGSAWTTLGVGSNGQAIVADSTQTLGVKWVTVSGGGGSGAMVLIETETASSSATLDFDSCISSTYDDYEFSFVSIVPATNAVILDLRLSTDGGATFDAGTNYRHAFSFSSSANVAGTSGSNSETSVGFMGTLSNTAADGVGAGWLRLFNPGSTTAVRHMEYGNSFKANDGNFYQVHGSGQWVNTSTAANAVRFLMSSGNIASGTIRCYGIAK